MTIRASFSEIDGHAQAIMKNAQQVSQHLEDLHKLITDYVNNYGAGAANEAFAQMQQTWNRRSVQLSDTLRQAGQVVSQGNQDLQQKDQSLSGLFH